MSTMEPDEGAQPGEEQADAPRWEGAESADTGADAPRWERAQPAGETDAPRWEAADTDAESSDTDGSDAYDVSSGDVGRDQATDS